MNLRTLALVCLAGLYCTWLYLSTLLFATLAESYFSVIGKALAGVLVAAMVVFEGKVMARVAAIVGLAGIALCFVAIIATKDVDSTGVAALQASYIVGSECVLVIVFSVVGYKEKYLRPFLVVLGILALVSSLVGIWGALTQKSFLSKSEVGVGVLGFDDETGRSGGLQGENYVGLWVAPALGLSHYLFGKAKARFLGVALALVPMAAVAASMSRTSVAAFAASVLTWILLWRRALSVSTLVVIGTGFAAGAYLIPVLIGKQFLGREQLRLEQGNRWQEIADMSGRYGIWGEVTNKVLESPVWGHGADAAMRNFGVVAHNALLDVAIDFGAIGLSLFLLLPCVILSCILVNLQKVRADEFTPILCSMSVPGIVCWMTLSAAWVNLIWVLFGVLFGRILLLKDQGTNIRKLSALK